jgi:hypothetical protein
VNAEILPHVLRGLTRRGEDGRELGDLLRSVLPALFDPGVEPPLVTELLSLVDQFLDAGVALDSGLGPRELSRLRALLEDAIAAALAHPSVPADPQAAALRDRLVGWMAALARDESSRLTVVTTNYDLAFEERLYETLGEDLAGVIDFGLRWRDRGSAAEPATTPPQHPCLEVFKLHGSLDWLHCDRCGHVSIAPGRRRPRDAAPLDAGAACACGYAPLRRLIIAPSMVRDLRNPNVQAVWHAALEALRAAEEWVFVGYSLPPEDLAIRTLLLRAHRARPSPPEVTVVDRGQQPEVERRYRLLLPGLRFEPGGLEAFVAGLEVPAG